jgi:PAS domain S-box-containing protein
MVETRAMKFEKVIDQAHIGLAELDAEGCFASANPSYLSMLGVQEADLVGQHWHATVHPDDHVRVEEAYRMARSKGRGYAEIRGVRNNSGIVYQALAVTAITDTNGEFRGYSCLRHEISDYKRNQEALTLAVESSPNGLVMLNAAGEIQFANRAVENLFGYRRSELLGNTMETLLPPRFRERHHHFRQAFSRSESKEMVGRDLWGLRKDGVEIPLQVHVNRIETDIGTLILCTVIDIAERVKHERQLELAKQAAEAANRAKSDFLARMSHEIRTPMNLITGMNVLLLESELTDKQRQHLEISHRNARRLLRLINGILDLSKVEAGKLTLESAPFDLHEVMRECAGIASSVMEQKGLQFEMSIEPGAWRYWVGDAERLHQVILNLIGNSVKFTDKGKIEMNVRGAYENGRIGLRFEVSDTGCGIPPDKAAIIFEAFQQADSAMNRRFEGTGLGLAIAKTLVEMMGGKIRAERKSEPGAKIVFTAFFPASDEDAVRERRSAATSTKVIKAAEAGTRVLLVEDNPENLILLQAYLNKFPLSLDFASNGVEAIEKRKQASYDLILMDIQMPIMDGYTATREIRAWETEHQASRVPIVALTAHALSGASTESMEAGCDGHVTKPVEQSELIEAIAKYAKRPQDQVVTIDDPIAARRPEYCANRRLDLTKMQNAMAHGDFGTVKVIGHNCKGTGTGYGFPEISRLGFVIENAAIAGDGNALQESLQEFERCVLAGCRVPPKK